ncbi:HIT family protein [Gracilimonas mengyeensis]|uniref:Histidine triad (HIT) family protein n=1 Tax=Gracilimonas mengyeensis TaxID=1302730 RepID=A0A521CH82_9BACT|nr:HIT family protein [Gracilimonas mengyeensis]SMO58784.1 histidine triad (HIT) family protein [Gracilimonas mengyeensis]
MASIFTKIIQGDIPSYKIAEDDKHYAFLDINPAAEGHVLCIPKKEVDYIFDLPAEELSALMEFSQKVAKGIDEALEPIRTGIIVEGMEVPHAHVHLIPIYEKTQAFSLGKKVDPNEERMQELANQISGKVAL